MKAVMLAHDLILAGTNQIMIAGGMESMSNSPYLLDKARSGYRMGHGKVLDHMFMDGLEDAETGRLMGAFAFNGEGIHRFPGQLITICHVLSESAHQATGFGVFQAIHKHDGQPR
jgi:hypothetical protein